MSSPKAVPINVLKFDGVSLVKWSTYELSEDVQQPESNKQPRNVFEILEIVHSIQQDLRKRGCYVSYDYASGCLWTFDLFGPNLKEDVIYGETIYGVHIPHIRTATGSVRASDLPAVADQPSADQNGLKSERAGNQDSHVNSANHRAYVGNAVVSSAAAFGPLPALIEEEGTAASYSPLHVYKHLRKAICATITMCLVHYGEYLPLSIGLLWKEVDTLGSRQGPSRESSLRTDPFKSSYLLSIAVHWLQIGILAITCTISFPDLARLSDIIQGDQKSVEDDRLILAPFGWTAQLADRDDISSTGVPGDEAHRWCELLLYLTKLVKSAPRKDCCWVRVKVVLGSGKDVKTLIVEWPRELCFLAASRKECMDEMRWESLNITRYLVDPLTAVQNWKTEALTRQRRAEEKRRQSEINEDKIVHYTQRTPMSDVFGRNRRMREDLVNQASQVYPTPPEVPKSQVTAVLNNLGLADPDSLVASPNAVQDPGTVRTTITDIYAGTPTDAMVVDMYNGTGNDDLFGDDEEMYGDHGLTEDDFNFFDDANGPAAPKMSRPTSSGPADVPLERADMVTSEKYSDQDMAGVEEYPELDHSKDWTQDFNHDGVPYPDITQKLDPLENKLVDLPIMEIEQEIKPSPLATRRFNDKYTKSGKFHPSSPLLDLVTPLGTKSLVELSVPELRHRQSSWDACGDDEGSEGSDDSSEDSDFSGQHSKDTDAFSYDFDPINTGISESVSQLLIQSPSAIAAAAVAENFGADQLIRNRFELPVSIDIAQAIAEQLVSYQGFLRSLPLSEKQEIESSALQNVVIALKGSLTGIKQCQFENLATFGDDHGSENSTVIDKADSDNTIRETFIRNHMPKISVMREHSALELDSVAVHFWEELGLGPADGAKDLIAFMIYPSASEIRRGCESFMRQVRDYYSSFRFGALKLGCTAVANDYHDGFLPVPVTELNFEAFSQSLKKVCQEFGSSFPSLIPQKTRVAIYIINPFDSLATIPQICHCFKQIKDAVQATRSSEEPLDEVVLKIVPIKLVLPTTLTISLWPQTLRYLIHDLYDSYPSSISRIPYSTSWACRLATPLPKTISFRISSEPNPRLFTADMDIHLAYSLSRDFRWLSVAITNNHGTQTWQAPYCLGKNVEQPWSIFFAAIVDILKTVLEMVGPTVSDLRVYVAKDATYEDIEIKAWHSAAKSPAFNDRLLITLVKADENPMLTCLPQPAAPPDLATMMTDDISMSHPTPFTPATPAPTTPDNQPSPRLPLSAAARAMDALDNDPNARLVDPRKESWSIICSQHLNAVHADPGDITPQAVGYLARRRSLHDRDGFALLCVKVIHSEQGYDLKGLLETYDQLSMMSRTKGLCKDSRHPVPWHICVAGEVRKSMDDLCLYVPDE